MESLSRFQGTIDIISNHLPDPWMYLYIDIILVNYKKLIFYSV